MSATDALNKHLELCEKVYQLLLEENSILRQTQEAGPLTLLDQKASLLPELKRSVDALKAIERGTPSLKGQIEAAQKKSMKIFHLSRENEQLLLGAGSSVLNRTNHGVAASRRDVKRAYGA